MRQGPVKVGHKAALPPDVRKASGFPAQAGSLPPLARLEGCAFQPRGLVRVEVFGKAEPFRTSGGRAALGCYVSGTLTQSWWEGTGHWIPAFAGMTAFTCGEKCIS